MKAVTCDTFAHGSYITLFTIVFTFAPLGPGAPIAPSFPCSPFKTNTYHLFVIALNTLRLLVIQPNHAWTLDPKDF